MVETDDINERVLLEHDRALLKRIFEQASHRRENPLSFSENINWYIDSANRRLENEPDVETLGGQLKTLDDQLKIEHDKSARREILRKMNALVDLPGNLRSLIREGNAALEHFEAGDIDRGLLAYDQMHQYRVKCNLPFQKEEFIHAQRVEDGSKGGKASKRPLNPLTPMLEAITGEIKSKDTGDVLAWWEDLTSPSSAMEGVGRDYECYYDMGSYHYYQDGKQVATKREIQQELSRIRRERRK